jgi:thiamine-phosphate pyrophosphorylase
MKRRQTLPRQWLIADARMGKKLWEAIDSLPRGSGVFVLFRDLPKGDRTRMLAKLRRAARLRDLVIADEAAGHGFRVHSVTELRIALLNRIPMILLSPMNVTVSHPDWRPIPRMRAAALGRLARRRLFALGGMNEARFRRLERLGFQGWAGIDAWIRT